MARFASQAEVHVRGICSSSKHADPYRRHPALTELALDAVATFKGRVQAGDGIWAVHPIKMQGRTANREKAPIYRGVSGGSRPAGRQSLSPRITYPVVPRARYGLGVWLGCSQPHGSGLGRNHRHIRRRMALGLVRVTRFVTNSGLWGVRGPETHGHILNLLPMSGSAPTSTGSSPSDAPSSTWSTLSHVELLGA